MNNMPLASQPPRANHTALWSQLESFQLDVPAHGLVFSERLARENAWSPNYTRRAIVEYKRFLFLAMTSSHVVCPSDAVDQVWHMHLTYTRSYWNDLTASGRILSTRGLCSIGCNGRQPSPFPWLYTADC